MSKPLPLTQSPPYQVLVVDDDSGIRENLKEYLTHYHQADYRLSIDEASTAEDALEKLEKKQYDLVISDINLPDKDGFFILNKNGNTIYGNTPNRINNEFKKEKLDNIEIEKRLNMLCSYQSGVTRKITIK